MPFNVFFSSIMLFHVKQSWLLCCINVSRETISLLFFCFYIHIVLILRSYISPFENEHYRIIDVRIFQLSYGTKDYFLFYFEFIFQS